MSRREIVRSGKVVSVTASEEAEPRVEAFCATRLGDAGGRAFGTLPRDVDTRAILGHAAATDAA